MADWVDARGIDQKDVLVYYDDVALPLGTIRLRPSGSSGGHNGLASILDALGSNDVPRFRIGIKPVPQEDNGTVDTAAPVPHDLADFVLAPFASEERPVIRDVIDRVVDATHAVLNDGMTKAMSRFNGPIDRG